jgi:hypothetical protein
MTTPNTWGNEYYHRLSQTRPFYPPPPLPDDPGPPEARTYSRKDVSRAFSFGFFTGAIVWVFWYAVIRIVSS